MRSMVRNKNKIDCGLDVTLRKISIYDRTQRLTPDLRRRARYGETAFDETGRVRVQCAGEARLFTADRNLEPARFNYCSAVVCDYRELTWLERELDDAPLTWLQMHSFDSCKRANRCPNGCC